MLGIAFIETIQTQPRYLGDLFVDALNQLYDEVAPSTQRINVTEKNPHIQELQLYNIIGDPTLLIE